MLLCNSSSSHLEVIAASLYCIDGFLRFLLVRQSVEAGFILYFIFFLEMELIDVEQHMLLLQK